jgi:hypothetical protein
LRELVGRFWRKSRANVSALPRMPGFFAKLPVEKQALYP